MLIRNLWVSTVDGYCGILKFDGNDWTHLYKKNSVLPDDDVLCVYVESNNRIWMGLGNGNVVIYENEPVSVSENLRNNNYNFHIYPNPVNKGEKIFIDFNLSQSGYQEVQLIGVLGNLVERQKVESNLSFPTENLTLGIYFVRLINSSQVITKPFIVR